MRNKTRTLTEKQIEELIEFLSVYRNEWCKMFKKANIDGIIGALSRDRREHA